MTIASTIFIQIWMCIIQTGLVKVKNDLLINWLRPALDQLRAGQMTHWASLSSSSSPSVCIHVPLLQMTDLSSSPESLCLPGPAGSHGPWLRLQPWPCLTPTTSMMSIYSAHATSIACLSVPEEGSLLCGSWGFFHFSLLKGFWGVFPHSIWGSKGRGVLLPLKENMISDLGLYR